MSTEAIGQLRREFALTKWSNPSELPHVINKLERIQYQSTFSNEDVAISDKELCVQLTLYYPHNCETKMTQIRSDLETQYNWSKLKENLLREHKLRNLSNNYDKRSSTNQKQKKNFNNDKTPTKTCDTCKEAGRTKIMHTHNTKDCRVKTSTGKESIAQVTKGKIGQIGPSDSSEIIIDTGATSHMTNNKKWLYSIEPHIFHAELANGKIVTSLYKGKLDLTLENGEQGTLTDVHYSPGFSGTLLSFSKMDESGCILQSSRSGLNIYKSGDLIIQAEKKNNLYVINSIVVTKSTSDNEKIYFNKVSNTCTLMMLHRRIGHPNIQALKKIPSHAKDIKFTGTLPSICDICIMAKGHELPYHRQSDNFNAHSIGRLDFDVSGPHIQTEIGDYKYYLVALLPKHNFIFAAPLKSKSSSSNELIAILKWIKNKKNMYPCELRSDNALEFSEIEKFATEEGIEYSHTSPRATKQNSHAERTIRTLNETLKAFLIDGKISAKFWNYALNQAVYVAIEPQRNG